MKTKMIYVEGNDLLTCAYAEQYIAEYNPEEYMVCRINAGDGYRENLNNMALACEYCTKDVLVIVTNAIHLLSMIALSMASPDDHDELWFAHKDGFVNAYDIYENIRPENNLMKMYINGYFEIKGEDNE